MPDKNLLNRIRVEFLEMPGLRLTPAQVQRLCGIERTQCQQALATLVATKFLCLRPNGTYARLTEGADDLGGGFVKRVVGAPDRTSPRH